MSDDLREQIARALYESYTLPGEPPWSRSENQHFFLHKADAVLTVVQPVIEQAERERDEWKAAEAEARMTIGDEAARHMLRADAAEARVATLEAALREYARHNRSCRYSGMHWTPLVGGGCTCGLDAALGEQDTTVTTTYGTENPVRKPKHLTYLGEQDTPAERCPTCGSDDPTRQQGLPHTDLHAQVRCRDPWHSAPPV